MNTKSAGSVSTVLILTNKMEAIKTKRLILRPFTTKDITAEYINWLNDKRVNRFLDSRSVIQTKKTVSKWVQDASRDPSRMALGIFLKNSHIGNITFYDIDRINRSLCVGIAIGRLDLHGNGYGTEALCAAVRYAFNNLKMHRIEAGVNEVNSASKRLFEKCGFRREAIFRKRLFFEGRFVSKHIYTLFNGK